MGRQAAWWRLFFTGPMRTTGLIFTLLMLLAVLPDQSRAAGTEAVFPLPDTDRAAIEAGLGQGVVGPAVAAPRIDDPSHFFQLAAGLRTFRIVQGPRAGDEQPFRFFSAQPPSAWRYRSGDEEVGFIEALEDGSLVLRGVKDIQAAAVTRYDPPEPFLVKGLEPGEERRLRMAVRVFDADRPGEVAHSGELDVTYRYLGAYRLAVPAGTFDAVLLKSTFRGRVGPARLEDTQYRFFAPRAGLLATLEDRHVSAFVVYQSDTKIGKVLARTGS